MTARPLDNPYGADALAEMLEDHACVQHHQIEVLRGVLRQCLEELESHVGANATTERAHRILAGNYGLFLVAP